MSLLCTEIALLPRQGERLSSIFIGGGTPSVLPDEALPTLLGRIGQRFDLTGAEISAEANPGTLGEEKLAAWKQAGINRLSFGVQSMNDGELARIGRIHSAKQAEEAFALARRAGFENINIDLMYGLPGQTKQSCQYTLERVIALRPEHISFYSLILEEGTPLFADVSAGTETLPTEDETGEIGDAGARLLTAAGYERYEVSNFARPGKRCRHNLLYWQSGDFLAAGLGASFALWSDGTVCRGSNTADWADYARIVRENTPPVAERVTETGRDAMFIFAMMGLRLVEGFSRAEFARRFGVAFETAFPKTAKSPLLAMDRGGVRLTERGFDLMNILLEEMLEEI